MKFQAYKFEEDNIKLEFSFKEDDKIGKNKKTFTSLMKEAIKLLEEE